MVIRFAGGAIGSLGSTGSVLPGQDEMLEYRIFGDKGHIIFDVNEGEAVIYGAEGEVSRLPGLPAEERYPDWAPADNLVDIVLGRGTNGSPASLGVLTVEFVDAMYRAAKEGRTMQDRRERGVMTDETISRVEAFPLRYAEPNNNGKTRHVTLVRLETAGGAVGWGEAITGSEDAALAMKVIVDRGFRDAADRPRSTRRRGDLGRIPRFDLLVWQWRDRDVRHQRHRHGAVGSRRHVSPVCRFTGCSAASAGTAFAQPRRSSSTPPISPAIGRQFADLKRARLSGVERRLGA